MSQIMNEDIVNISNALNIESNTFSGKTILITGGAGFLGRYFIRFFDYINKNILEEPCKIISLDNFITGSSYPIEEGPYFKSIKHDIKVPLEIEGGIDYIIHAAGIASPKFYRQFKIETIDVATMGTRNMLQLAKDKQVKSMVFFSSSEVYGDPDPAFIPTPETYRGNVSCTGARSNYDESKRLGETLCVAFYETYEVPVKMIRPFNVFGPGMRLDDARVLPNFVSFVFENKPIPIYGLGDHTRTFCYISDAIVGFLKVLLSDHNAEPFNIGDDNFEVSMMEFAKITSEVLETDFGQSATIERVQGINDAYASADPKRRCPDLTKAKTKLKYSPQIDLRTGIKRFIQWAIETDQINTLKKQ